MKSLISRVYSRFNNFQIDKQDITSLNIWLTNRCNLNCVFCPIVTNSQESPKELSIEYIEKFLDKFSEVFPKAKDISLSGGEPLIHSQFLEVYTALKQKRYTVGIFTNGVYLNKLNEAGIINEFSHLTVSLHSIDAYEQLFGTKIFRIKEQVINNLLELDVKTKKKTKLTIGITTLKNAESTIDFARKNGFMVELFFIRNFKQAYRLTNQINQSNVDEEIFRFLEKNSDVISSPCKHKMQKLLKIHQNNFSWSMPCRFPLQSLILDYNQEIRLCCGDYQPIGKALDIPIVLENELSKQIRLNAFQRTGICKNCSIGVDPCIKCMSLQTLLRASKESLVGANKGS